MTAPTSTKLRNIGISQEELDRIVKDRARLAMLNTITSRDFPRVAIETQFVAMMLKGDDELRATYLHQLDALILTRMSELMNLRAAYRNVAGKSHATDTAH